jgi:serine/threonine-protein kinase
MVRRNRLAFAAVIAVAAALILGAAVSTWQAIRATRAERQASLERNRALDERARAEDLLTFMLGDLHTQLAKVGRLDVLESAGNKAMAYFTSIDPQELTDTALARQAKALSQFGEIRMNQARYPEASIAFAEAYARASALAARHPQDGDMLFERGQAEYWIGFAHWQRGEFGAAQTWLTRYNETCRYLVTLDPAREAWQSEVAYGQHNLAVLAQERGELAGSRADFIAELETLEKLSAAVPADTEMKFRISLAHSWLGSVAEQQGDFTEAMAQYVLQATRLEQLVQLEPRTPRWRLRLANALTFQSDIKAVTGKTAEAGGRLKEARRLLDDLVALDPANRDWQSQALISRLKEARLTLHAGELAETSRNLAGTRPKLESLFAAEPSDRGFVLDLATSWRLEAQLRSASRQTDAGLAAARAVELGEKLVQDGRATTADLGEYARACVVAGEIAGTTGDAAEASRYWRRAGEILAPYLKETRDWRLLDPAARAAAWLGQTTEAHAIIARLNSLGYVPPDPWPDSDRPPAPMNSNPQPQPK